MNKQEAIRYAHKIVAEMIAGHAYHEIDNLHDVDKAKIARALDHMRETHERTGPRTGDKPPRQPEYKGERLNFGGTDASELRWRDDVAQAYADADRSDVEQGELK